VADCEAYPTPGIPKHYGSSARRRTSRGSGIGNPFSNPRTVFEDLGIMPPCGRCHSMKLAVTDVAATQLIGLPSRWACFIVRRLAHVYFEEEPAPRPICSPRTRRVSEFPGVTPQPAEMAWAMHQEMTLPRRGLQCERGTCFAYKGTTCRPLLRACFDTTSAPMSSSAARSNTCSCLSFDRLAFFLRNAIGAVSSAANARLAC
jgi:hypothetical protein